ncbi:T9SS type A sorting domain-containing protein [Ekhidna sp.]
MKYVSAGILIFISLASAAQCESCNQGSSGAVWEGDVDSNWENPNNWSGNTLPTGGAITIDGDLYTNAPIITVNSSFSPTDVFIQDGASLTLQADLSLTDDYIIRNNSSLNIQSGSNATGDDLNLCAGGSINMSGGSLDNTSGSGILRVCTSTPAGATGTTEINITGGSIVSTTSSPESGVIGDYINTSGGGTYTDDGGLLPVDLISFTGKATASNVTLEWSTATEINNQYFDIQRSWDGVNFTTIGRVVGHGTTNSIKNYEFVDQNPWKEGYYRLLQVDFDGSSEYHSTIRVEQSLGADLYQFSYKHDKSGPIRIQSIFDIKEVRLINSSGQILASGMHGNSLEIQTANFDAGIYFLQIQWGNSEVREKILLID